MSLRARAVERRRWPRLALGIPVFVRSSVENEKNEKEFLEFATALNVSAGGMLVAVRRSLPSLAEISLEIPSAPIAAMATLPSAARNLQARVLRLERGESYNLIALKFSRPLVTSRPRVKAQARRTKHAVVVTP